MKNGQARNCFCNQKIHHAVAMLLFRHSLKTHNWQIGSTHFACLAHLKLIAQTVNSFKFVFKTSNQLKSLSDIVLNNGIFSVLTIMQ